jgi:hypothetical protein
VRVEGRLRADGMNAHLHFDYTVVGHVTADVLDDGSRRAGGTAFYSALQAARLGCRTLILTQGVPQEIEALLEPYRDEIELDVRPAPATTTLQTQGCNAARTQRVLAWAGPMLARPRVDTEILHLAPVARECPPGWRGPSAFVGLTPQGLARTWSNAGAPPAAPRAGAGEEGAQGEITLTAPEEGAVRLASGCNAVVVSDQERASCQALIRAATDAGAVAAITAAAAPTTILLARGPALELEVPAIEEPGEDLGAGDVFAAAFFIALADGQSPDLAAAFANAAAAVRMRGPGASAIGDRAAISTRLHAAARIAQTGRPPRKQSSG